jgi:hypothetical protein
MKLGDNFATDGEPLSKRTPPIAVDIQKSWKETIDLESSAQSKGQDYVPYEMGPPSLLNYLLFIPNAINHSLCNMASVFGWKFILSVFVVYGFQQGLGNSWFFQV